MCDGNDDCGDLSDEDHTSICKGFYVNNFESETQQWGLFTNEKGTDLQWRVSIPEWLDRGILPTKVLFDTPLLFYFVTFS